MGRMADVYVSDTTFAAYVSEYGEDAKTKIREVVDENKPA